MTTKQGYDVAYTYEANGNLASLNRGAAWSYDYQAQSNRLEAVVGRAAGGAVCPFGKGA